MNLERVAEPYIPGRAEKLYLERRGHERGAKMKSSVVMWGTFSQENSKGAASHDKNRERHTLMNRRLNIPGAGGPRGVLG